MLKIFLSVCRILIILLLLILPELSAQENNSVTIRGIVLDVSSHLPLQNAVVQIPLIEAYAATDSSGIFEFRDIPPGKYSLQASYVGYKKYSEEITISGKDVLGIIIHLIPVPFQTSTIVVTGEHPNSRFDDLYEFTNVLKGKELDRDLGTTLASTLKNETGLAIRSMGPAPARPVIRGLGADRVFISEDGFKTTDLSASSPDHAVSVEPFTIERIEVIRGPRILLQNSSTFGGVVNIIRGDIPSTVPGKISGSAGIYGETANNGYLGALTLSVPVNEFVFRGELSGRKASDLYTPAGFLPNSGIENINYSGGISYIKDWGHAGASLREFESDYGIPGGFVGAHPNGVNINMFKREWNAKVMMKSKYLFINETEILFARNYYHHTEFENSDLIGAEFSIINYDAKINFATNKLGPFETGMMGFSSEYQDFKVGGYVFTPPTESFKYSAYFFQALNLSDLSIELAARYNYDLLKPVSSNNSDVDERKFNTYSASLSLLYELSSGFFTGGTLSRSSRVPSIEELYSEGPHLAAYSYEVGNPLLDDEKGIGAELFFYNKSDRHFFNLTFFRNDFSYYIIPRNTGEINFNTLLPIYQTTGIAAVLYGSEAQLDYKVWRGFEVSASVSYTNGSIKDTEDPLPAIPPLKGLLELKYQFDNLLTGISVEAAAAQERTDIFEEPTAGYIIPNMFLQYSFFWFDVVSNLSVSFENIFNKEYRNHLSRIKVIMPEAGRNLKATLRIFF